MKKIFATLLITILLLSSCSVDWNDEKDKRISELEKQVKDETFKKKQECAKYIPILENKIKQKEKELNVDGDYYHETTDEVFYSNFRETCISIGKSTYIINNKNVTSGGNIKMELKLIYDLLSNELTNYDIKDKDTMSLYYKDIDKLKYNTNPN